MGPDRSGMPSEHSQTLLGHFCKKSCFVKKTQNLTGNHGNVHGPENRFNLENNGNTKDTHRHDSNFRGPMASPSSMWSPFVKKRVLAKTSFSLVIAVHAQGSCACTRFLCVVILVRAQESCARTSVA